ncbi:hypothetical protein BTM25_30060 [Actinomadura rubteroloni]|uniref:ABC transporter permease n=1 Tax=Actinomadura rubteroloni TaxID=1926885 RepID=A0A2P4UH36_9ACTN|nr:hypothetical protein [Actinomadura rubteroloni]POM24377.1 hypothetical protein BTM25_30060 [Actinomadura rubteroloni]
MQSSPALRAVGVGLLGAVLQIVMVVAFAWPAARTAPRDVPIVAAGPGAAAVAQRLERERPGAFDVTTVRDEAAARAAVTGRDAYGALLAGPSGVRVLVASGASPVVAQQLEQIAQPAQAGASARVEDLAPLPASDPRGAGFGALVLPLIMSGIGASVLFTYALRSAAWRAAGVAVFAVAGGLASTALAQGWLGVLSGPYAPVAACTALAVAAVAGTVTGLASFGQAGLGAGALTFLLLGNPLSGAASAPELLPEPWGAIGQWLPPGAAVTLIRSAAFFDGSGAGRPLAILAGWAVAGLLLLAAGAVRARAAEHEPVHAA